MGWELLLGQGLALSLKISDVLGRWLAPGEEDLEKLREDTRAVLADLRTHGEKIEAEIKARHEALQAAIDAAKSG